MHIGTRFESVQKLPPLLLYRRAGTEKVGRKWKNTSRLKTAAEYICRTMQAARKLMRTGQIPATRGDRKVRLRKSDIDAWAAPMTKLN
jgi:hypothetical protein